MTHDNDTSTERTATEGGEAAQAADGRAPSRRSLLGWGGAGLALGAVAAGGTAAALRTGSDAQPAGADATAGSAIAFHGSHQAGIASAVQDRLHFAAFDVTTDDRDELIALLKEWTKAAARMTAGDAVGDGAVGGLPEAPPDDTGEALGLPPSRLTLTFGIGPTLFEKDGKDRFGIKARRPEALIELPQFPGDNLDKARSGGDLCVQACADDPQVAVHAIRNLARIGFGKVAIHNLAGTDSAALDKHVWVADGDAKGKESWMAGGSYLVARRIRMHIETWDRTSLQEQEDIFGRNKGEGAPVGKKHERDTPHLKSMLPTAHVRLAHPDSNGGVRILRRGYSFTDGTDGLGRLDAGLFFLAYQRDVRQGFVPLQKRLAANDALNEYIQHVGSAVFAVPPGVRNADDWWGRALFA
jgi:deferrochelatase/peroxidase EfeB